MTNHKVTLSTFISFCEEVAKLLADGETLSITVKDSKKAKLSAKAQVQIWFEQVSRETGDNKKDIEARCKRDFGLPILFSRGPDDNDASVTDFVLSKTGFYTWSEEDQIKLISLQPVTRLLSTKEHNRYRDSVQSYFVQNGFDLKYLNR